MSHTPSAHHLPSSSWSFPSLYSYYLCFPLVLHLRFSCSSCWSDMTMKTIWDFFLASGLRTPAATNTFYMNLCHVKTSQTLWSWNTLYLFIKTLYLNCLIVFSYSTFCFLYENEMTLKPLTYSLQTCTFLVDLGGSYSC